MKYKNYNKILFNNGSSIKSIYTNKKDLIRGINIPKLEPCASEEELNKLLFSKLIIVTIGDKVWFTEEKMPYTIRARCERYLICTKPFAAKKTVMYTIVDLVEKIRGTEGVVFSMGAESDEDCNDMINRLQGIEESDPEGDQLLREMDIPILEPIHTEISHKNRIPLSIKKVFLFNNEYK